MLESFNQESAGACRRIKNRLAQSRIDHGHDELHQRPRRVELARITGGIAHFLQHAFVQVPQGVDLVAGSEMDIVDPTDDIAQEIAVDHPVDRSLEDFRDDISRGRRLRFGARASRQKVLRPFFRPAGLLHPG